jgi:hypothetical protein
METEVSLCGPSLRVTLRTADATQLVESQPVKRRLGNSCDMAASLGVSYQSAGSYQLRVEFCMGGCEDGT